MKYGTAKHGTAIRSWSTALLTVLTLLLVGCPAEDSAEALGGGRVAEDSSRLPPAPAELICESNELDVFLSWENGAAYREIQVTRDGVVVATLSGGASSFSDGVPRPGSYTYGVKGRDSSGEWSEAELCTVEASLLPDITGVMCGADPERNTVQVIWTLPRGTTFEKIRIFRNDRLIAELGGNAIRYIDSSPPSGTVDYAVRGVRGNETTKSSECSVRVAVPAGIENLTAGVDESNGDIVLEWRNGSSYDEIVILLGGSEAARLDGEASSFRLANDSFGIFNFSVCGVVGKRESEPARAELSLGRLVWDPDDTGLVAGYYIYAWAEGDPVPSKDQPALTVGRESSVSLSELLTVGALPYTAEPASFSVAVAAFDAEGNVSDLSDMLSFRWVTYVDENIQ